MLVVATTRACISCTDTLAFRLYKVVSEFFIGELSEYILFPEVRAVGAGEGIEDGLDAALDI